LALKSSPCIGNDEFRTRDIWRADFQSAALKSPTVSEEANYVLRVVTLEQIVEDFRSALKTESRRSEIYLAPAAL
jgi:hypothetical protein